MTTIDELEEKKTFSNIMDVRYMGDVLGVDPRTGVHGHINIYDITHCDVDPELGLLEHIFDSKTKLANLLGKTVDPSKILPDIPRQVKDLGIISDLELRVLKGRGVIVHVSNVAVIE